jgi:hypothetical protein
MRVEAASIAMAFLPKLHRHATFVANNLQLQTTYAVLCYRKVPDRKGFFLVPSYEALSRRPLR